MLAGAEARLPIPWLFCLFYAERQQTAVRTTFTWTTLEARLQIDDTFLKCCDLLRGYGDLVPVFFGDTEILPKS